MERRTRKAVSRIDGISKFHKRYGKPRLYSNGKARAAEMKEYINSGIDIVSNLDALYLRKNRGSRAIFLFPMTSAASSGDFVRGVLKVLSPQSKAVFLRTPLSSTINKANSEKQSAMISRQLRQNGLMQSDSIVLMDFFGLMRTTNLVAGACGALGLQQPQIKDISPIHTLSSSRFGISHTHGMAKTIDGKMIVPNIRNVIESKRKSSLLGEAFAREYLKRKKRP